MPQIARRRKQERFDLYPDDPEEGRLAARLAQLGENSQQRGWIVGALLAKLKAEEASAAEVDTTNASL